MNQNIDLQGLLNNPAISQALRAYLPNAFSAELSPKKIPQFRNEPKYQKRFKFNEGQDYFSSFKVWVHEATYEFKNPSVFVSLVSSGKSAFSKISVAELRQLGETLIQFSQEIDAIMPELQAKAEVLNPLRENFINKFEENNNGE